MFKFVNNLFFLHSQSIIPNQNLSLKKSYCDSQYIYAPNPNGSGHSKISYVKDWSQQINGDLMD